MNPTERFTNRAGYYAQYRPGYPGAIIDTLEAEAGLRPGMMIADIGAGTGISSGLFLRRGYAVTAIEPNEKMRAEATARLGANPAFWTLSARAEATGLPAGSMDAVVCAQAFHWFEPRETRAEILRILRPGGVFAAFWNLRSKDASPFMKGLEALLHDLCPTYRDVHHDTAESVAAVRSVLPETHSRTFHWTDSLDRMTFLGRLLSASYVPLQGSPNHDAFLEGVWDLFRAHARNSRIEMLYETHLHWAQKPGV